MAKGFESGKNPVQASVAETGGKADRSRGAALGILVAILAAGLVWLALFALYCILAG